MRSRKSKPSGKKIKIHLKAILRKHPALFYLSKWSFMCLVIGSLIGSASAAFLLALEWATNFRETHLWLIALLPLAGFAVGALYHYFGKDTEAGNNLLIDTIHKPEKIIPFRMAPFVFLGTVATHFFGGSAGREGTALQMAGAIADQFSKPFRLSVSDRSALITAAVAGGFGSVFGTPLAGTFFALEFFLIGKIRYNAIFPALLMAVIADYATKFWGAHHTHYHINSIPELNLQNIFFAIIAGIFFGLCARLFSKSLRKAGHLFKSKIAYPPLQPVVGGVIVAAAVWALGTTKYIGLGIPTIVDSFEMQLPAYDFIFKMAFTIVTLAAGFKGGEVTPLFFIGAALGNALGYFIPLPVGLLAGMGFVAVFSGATNTPLACSLMAVELFGAEAGVFTAIACVVAYLLSGHTGIYGRQMIGKAKLPWFSSHEGKRINEL